MTRQEEVREQERETEMRDTEMLLSDRIRKLETDNEHEERVTAEVESFLRDQHLELSSKMEAWTRWDRVSKYLESEAPVANFFLRISEYF